MSVTNYNETVKITNTTTAFHHHRHLHPHDFANVSSPIFRELANLNYRKCNISQTPSIILSDIQFVILNTLQSINNEFNTMHKKHDFDAPHVMSKNR